MAIVSWSLPKAMRVTGYPAWRDACRKLTDVADGGGLANEERKRDVQLGCFRMRRSRGALPGLCSVGKSDRFAVAWLAYTFNHLQ